MDNKFEVEIVKDENIIWGVEEDPNQNVWAPELGHYPEWVTQVEGVY